MIRRFSLYLIIAFFILLSLALSSAALAGVAIISPLDGQTVGGVVPIAITYEGTPNWPVFYISFTLYYKGWPYFIEVKRIEPSVLSGTYTFNWDTRVVPNPLPDGAQVDIIVSAFWAGSLSGAGQTITVTVNNSLLKIDPAKQVPQDKVTTVAEPINIANGNMFTSAADIFIPAREIPLELSRTYNSQDDFNGSFGYGWRSNFDLILTEQSDGSIIEADEKGIYTIYTKNSDGAYKPSAGKYSLLTKNTDGSYLLLRKHGRKLSFDSQGRLAKVEDRNSNSINILRDAAGVISEVSDSSGRELLFTKDAQNRIIEVRGPVGRTFKYAYDANGNLIKVTGPLNNEALYAYDANRNLIRQTDANNQSIYYEYDSSDRAYRSWQDGNNNAVTLSFDPASKTTISTDSLGNITEYEYNTYGLVTKITDSQNNIQAFGWDDNLNKISATDAAGNTSIFDFDVRSNLLSIRDPLNNPATFTYEPNFELISSLTDALGNKREYLYDTKGNLTQIKDALGNTAEYFYDTLGQLIQTKDANNNPVNFSYDTYGNLAQITDAQSNSTNFSYDLIGNLIQITDAQGNSTQFDYDLLNRLSQITYADNSGITYAYDAAGNLISFADPNNNTTAYAYDVVNRLIQLTDAKGNITQYNYDTEGNRLSIVDANSNKTEYAYDSLNRLIQAIDPLNNQSIFSYGPAGNLIAKTDALGNNINYTYDVNNRLIRIIYLDASAVSFNYDALGRRTSMTDSTGTTTYAYDALSRIIQVDGPQNNDTISYAYDKLGNRIQMANQDGGVTNYAYDTLNRLVSLTDPQGKITTYAYDSLNNLIQVNYPNHTQTNYAFDKLKRLISLANKTNNKFIAPKVISSYIYDYNLSGMRTRVTLANNDYILYSYDSLNQLTQEQRYNATNELLYSLKYAYDAAGNRLAQESDFKTNDMWIKELPKKASLQYSYNPDNQLTQLNLYRIDTLGKASLAKIIDYTYDPNGNLIREADRHLKKIKTFGYDYENRLTQFTLIKPDVNEAQAFNFTYDGLGRRILQTVSGNPGRFYFYDGLNVILERDQSNQTLSTYTRGLSYGGGIGSIISVNEQQLYYHYDGLGSVTGLTDMRTNPKAAYTYDAFGNTLKQTGSLATNPYAFSTKEQDASGLIYFGARYYEPKLGRWVTKDPAGMVDGPNLYVYVNNNPINWVDPLGLKVYIGERPLPTRRGPGGHTAIILVPDNEEDFINDPRFTRNPITGKLEADISAGPKGDVLTPYSYNTDRMGSSIMKVQPINDPYGRSDTQLIKDILDSTSHYANDLYYDPFALGGCYNSNSYTRGVLKASRINNPQLPNERWYPGWTKPISLKDKR